MIKSSSPISQNKAGSSAGGWLATRLRAFGDRLFGEDDRQACEHGWQISPGRRGLSRRYRDPRFSRLRECPWCRGSGHASGRACPACRGTGRLPCQRQGTAWGGDGDAQQPFAQAQ